MCLAVPGQDSGCPQVRYASRRSISVVTRESLTPLRTRGERRVRPERAKRQAVQELRRRRTAIRSRPPAAPVKHIVPGSGMVPPRVMS